MRAVSYIGRSAADTFILLSGVAGITFSLISAYSFPADDGAVLLSCILFCLLYSFIFNLRGRIFSAAAVLLSLGAAAVFYERIINAFKGFLYLMLFMWNELARINISTDFIKCSYAAAAERTEDFFIILPALLALAAGFFIIRLKRFIPALAVIAPFAACCFVTIETIPDITAFSFFMAFCVICALTMRSRKGPSPAYARVTAALTPAVALLLFFVLTVFPQAGFTRPPAADRMFAFIDSLVALRRDNSSSASLPSGTSGDNSYTQPPLGFEMNPLPLTGIDAPEYTGETVFLIDTDYTGQLLLRGYSLGDYTGRQWEVPAYGVPEIASPGTLFSLSSSWTDAAVRTIDGTNEYFFGIYPSSSFAENESEIMFTPYFTDRAAFTTVFDSDCMTLVNKGMPYSGYFAVPQSMWELTDVHVASGGELENIFAEYEAHTAQYYLNIPDSLAESLRDYAKSRSPYIDGMTGRALTEEIARIIMNGAEYNDMVEAYPQNADFVLYFLNESREGRCVHFATAATLMYRAFGIPARFTVGYAAPVYGGTADVYDKYAHAWTEIFVSGIGWVPVDATPPLYPGAYHPVITPGDDSTAVSENLSEDLSGGLIEDISGNISGTVSHELSSEVSSEVSSGDSSAVSTDSSIPGEYSASSASEPSSPPAGPPADTRGIEIPDYVYAIITAAVLLAALIVLTVLRRRAAAAKREKAFSQSDGSLAALAAWKYITALSSYGVKPAERIYFLAQKAAFSHHTLTAEEAGEVTAFARASAAKVDSELKFLGKFVFRYIKALY